MIQLDEYQVSAAQTPALRATINAYNAELAARHSQLLDDLAIYQGKLRDLVQLDPLDFSQACSTSTTTHVKQIGGYSVNLMLARMILRSPPIPRRRSISSMPFSTWLTARSSEQSFLLAPRVSDGCAISTSR